MSENEQSPEQSGFEIRALPGPTSWIRKFACVVIIVGWTLAAILKNFWPVVISATLAIGGFLTAACTVSCPQCRRHLISRTREERPGFRREYYDCSECKITWSSEITTEED